MAWGLRYPEGAGDYSPDVTGPSEMDRLIKRHFNDVLTPEERAAFLTAGRWAYAEHTKFRENAEELPEYLMPTHDTLGRAYKNLASMMNVRGIVVVDKRLKQIIESLEPGTHQFWPFELRVAKQGTYSKTHFGLRIRNYVSGFRPDLSKESSFSGSGSTYTGSTTKAEADGIVIDGPAVNGIHIWRDSKLMIPEIFVSDELMKQIKDAGLRIFKSFHFREV